jgi:hypothetical protein
MVFSFFPVETIVRIHSLLLLEKSLVVIGTDLTLVSIVTTAFVHLLQPLKWAGIFVPILPPLAHEVLDAPVPFIIGVDLPGVYSKSETKRPSILLSPHASILYLDDFLNYRYCFSSTGVAVDNLDSSSRYTRKSQRRFSNYSYSNVHSYKPLFFEPITDNTLKKELAWFLGKPMNSKLFKPLCEKLIYLVTQFRWSCEHCGLVQTSPFANIGMKSSSPNGLNTPSGELPITMPYDVFVKCALMNFDPAIYVSVRKLLRVVREFNAAFTAGILTSSSTWQDICHEDEFSRALVVDSDQVMLPLRERVTFQEHLIRTQMFALLLDNRFVLYLHQQRTRLFIRDWLVFRFKKRYYHRQRSDSLRCRRKVPFHL